MQLPTAGQPAVETGNRKYRIFPGWWMLSIAAAAQYMSGPGQSYSVAAFKEPMQVSLGISDTSLSLAYGFATLLSGLSLPLVGRLVDRLGARRVLLVVATVLGAACLGMSRVTTLPGLYVGFSLIRCFGQGALVLISMWILGEWFVVRRGVAASIIGLGGSLSVMTIPLINHFFITYCDWHIAWVFLASIVWIVLIPATLLILRDRPEDLGLQPDGLANLTPTSPTERSVPPEDFEPNASLSQDLKPPTSQGVLNPGAFPDDGGGDAEIGPAHGEVVPMEPVWKVGDVLRDITFWKLLGVPASCGMIITALTFHQVSILGSRGVEPGWALGLISLQAFIATLFAFPAGWLTDRVDNRQLLAVAMVFLGLATALVLFMPIPHLAPVYAALLGLNGAILRTAGSVIWLNYYGRTNQGSIRGVAMSAMVLGAAIGPLPAAFSADLFDSYDAALVAFIAVSIAAGGLVLTARRPQLSP